MQRSGVGLPSDTANLTPHMAKEERFEAQTGVLILPLKYSDTLHPGLREAFDAFELERPQLVIRKATKAIRSTWSTNPTMVDLAWEHIRHRNPSMDFDVGDNPCWFTNKIFPRMLELGFTPGEPSQLTLFEFPAHWLISLAQALKQLRDRLKIEACVGDVTAILEQIRYGAVGHRKQYTNCEKQNRASQTEGTYPQLYDRIHLSNVPNYIGRTFTSYLYALPTMMRSETSYITSTCLRNPPRFDTVAKFDAEYVALHTEKDLEEVFHVRMKPKNDPVMPMCAYNQWYHSTIARADKNLMPRAKLHAWLYRLFFKIALPVERRKIAEDALIYSPINLTYLFRLCEHLHSIGYPSHWLSDVVSNLLSGTVITTARPPRSEPLKPREIDTTREPTAQCVEPFVAELSTLAAMWQPLLPFPILSNYIAPIEILKKYAITLANVRQEVNEYPVFILVFFKGTLPQTYQANLRSVLLSDECGNQDNKDFREGRVKIVSSWTWQQSSQTATFWLRGNEMQKMEERWRVRMFRTDMWLPQSDTYTADKIVDLEVRWVDQVNGKT